MAQQSGDQGVRPEERLPHRPAVEAPGRRHDAHVPHKDDVSASLSRQPLEARVEIDVLPPEQALVIPLPAHRMSPAGRTAPHPRHTTHRLPHDARAVRPRDVGRGIIAPVVYHQEFSDNRAIRRQCSEGGLYGVEGGSDAGRFVQGRNNDGDVGPCIIYRS